ncbi:MAG: type II toxin-antitoxin system RelE/ParE family toxin [Bacteroidota bacterium]|nr:type II toxin-antitoxin system RelE/ParE family toxin [Bacteroidota bacterium]
MNFNVIPTDRFKKEAKRLVKKYPSLKDELSELNEILEENPETGTSLGNNAYKIRIAIKSKGKGKSGGGRVISYLVTENKEIYLLTLFDKSEFDTIDDKTLIKIIETLNEI